MTPTLTMPEAALLPSEKLTDEQRKFADHLLASWGCRTWPEGKHFSVYRNDHVPIVRRAIKTALERRP